MAPQDQPNGRWKQTFFAIWGGLALSRIGSSIAHFALVWWLTDLTGSAAILVSATAVARVPQIVLGPLGGTLVDRWNRRVTMIVSDAVIALLSLCLALLFWSGRLEVWHVYVILIARSLAEIFHRPATQASTAILVPRSELPRVQGLNQALGGSIEIIGPPLGALAFALLDLHQVMLIDVITAVSAIVPLLLVRIPEPERKPRESAATVWTHMVEGFRYVSALPGFTAMIAVAVVLNFVSAPTWTLLPLYVRDVFGGDASDLGLIQAGFGAGLILGGLGLSLWGARIRRRTVFALCAVAVSQIGILGMASAPSNMLWVVGVSWAMFSAFNAVANGTIAALLQGAVAQEMQGRVQSAVSSGVMLAIPLGLAVSAPAVEAFGLRFWYFFSAIIAALGSLWAVTSPRVRRMDLIGAPEPDAQATEAMPVESRKHAELVTETHHASSVYDSRGAPASLPIRRNAVQ